MQEKTLPNQANYTSNIHSSEFGAISYDIFGSPYQKSGSFLANDSLNFGYLGKPYNADTELYDYGFRDYSPTIARFTTVDPIRDGRNWFSYVVNDPVNYVDLWGLCGSDKNISSFWDKLQVGLDVAGLIPGIGELADGANGVISLFRGDFVNAGLSFVSMIPVVGDGLGKGGKIGRELIEHGDNILDSVKTLDNLPL